MRNKNAFKKNRLIAMELMKRDRNEIMQTCKHEGMLILFAAGIHTSKLHVYADHFVLF